MLAKIYRLEGGGKFYIGFTTNSLNRRLNKHKSKSKEEISKNRPLYVYFRSLNWDGVRMILIKEVEVETRSDILQIEKLIIDEYKNDENCLNVTRPLITNDEKKQRDSEYGKKRRELFKEKERDRVKEWRHKNPEKWKKQYDRANAKKICID